MGHLSIELLELYALNPQLPSKCLNNEPFVHSLLLLERWDS